MISILESSVPGTVYVSINDSDLVINCSGPNGPRTYYKQDLLKLVIINADTYRSGGKAAVGAVVGGVLTGGIGLIAGAAFGGRRRQEGVYMAFTRDGHNVVFKTNAKSDMIRLQILANKLEVEAGLSVSKQETAPSGFLPIGWKQPYNKNGSSSNEIGQNRNILEAPETISDLDPVSMALLKQLDKGQS